MADQVIQAWDQRPDESNKAYAAFIVYRNMDPTDRTGTEVARQLSRSATLIHRWQSRYEWVKRAHAWDRHQLMLEERAMERERQRLARKRLAAAEQMLDAAAVSITAGFRSYRPFAERDGATLPPQLASAAMSSGAALAKAADQILGQEVTVNVDGSVTVVDQRSQLLADGRERGVALVPPARRT